MRKDKTLEFVWKGIGFGAEEGIFTHVLNGTYYLPWYLDIDLEYPNLRCFDVPVRQEDYARW